MKPVKKKAPETVPVCSVENCIRCGGSHTDVRVHQFARPPKRHLSMRGNEITSWAACPTTGDPILLWRRSFRSRVPDGVHEYTVDLPA